MSEGDVVNTSYSYKVKLLPSLVNNKNKADAVFELVKAEDIIDRSNNIIAVRDREKQKFTAGQIVSEMNNLGFSNFNMHSFITLWQEYDGKNPSKGYGCLVAKKDWRWYEKWWEVVKEECEKNRVFYGG